MDYSTFLVRNLRSVLASYAGMPENRRERNLLLHFRCKPILADRNRFQADEAEEYDREKANVLPKCS